MAELYCFMSLRSVETLDYFSNVPRALGVFINATFGRIKDLASFMLLGSCMDRNRQNREHQSLD